MKMHPKPMRRHSKHVEEFTFSTSYSSGSLHPIQIRFCRESDAASQLLVMNENDAKILVEMVAATIKFKDTSAVDVNPEEWHDFYKNLRSIIGEKVA